MAVLMPSWYDHAYNYYDNDKQWLFVVMLIVMIIMLEDIHDHDNGASADNDGVDDKQWMNE